MSQRLSVSPIAGDALPLPRPAFRYHPFLAIHLLEQRFPGSQRLGACGTDARGERVRLRPNPSLALPATDLEAVGYAPAREGQPTRVVAVVNFFGLYGATSPLPLWCAQALQHEVALADAADAADTETSVAAHTPGCAFLDLFNHRLISLRYRAWRRSRPYLSGAEGNEPLLNVLHAAIGSACLQPAVAANAPRFAGSLLTRTRSAAGLTNMLELLIRDDDCLPAELRCRVEVTQLSHACWVELCEKTDQDPLRVPPALGRGLRLDRGVLLGRRMLDRNFQLGVRIGPVDHENLLRLVRSDSPLQKRLLAWVAAYVRQPFNLRLEVKVPRWLLPQVKLPNRMSRAIAPMRLERVMPHHLKRSPGGRVMLIGELPNLEAACRTRTDLPALRFLRCASEAAAILPLLKRYAVDLVVLPVDALPVWDALVHEPALRQLPVLAVSPSDARDGWQPQDLADAVEQIAAALWRTCTTFYVSVPLCPGPAPSSQPEVLHVPG